MSKRTFQPNNRRRAKTHGFRLRMRTRAGRAIVAARRRKGRQRAVGLIRPRPLRVPCCLPPIGCGDRASSRRSIHHGVRARRGSLVLYHYPALTVDAPPRVGLVVGSAVGGSVVRNRVRRRLRAELRSRLDGSPAGSGTVVRALPTGGGGATTRDVG